MKKLEKKNHRLHSKDKEEIPIKPVFVDSRSKKNDYLVFTSTDTALGEEITQTDGKDWTVEVYFKICKQDLRLTPCQGIAYDEQLGYTRGVCLAYVCLSRSFRCGSEEFWAPLFLHAVKKWKT